MVTTPRRSARNGHVSAEHGGRKKPDSIVTHAAPTVKQEHAEPTTDSRKRGGGRVDPKRGVSRTVRRGTGSRPTRGTTHSPGRRNASHCSTRMASGFAGRTTRSRHAWHLPVSN